MRPRVRRWGTMIDDDDKTSDVVGDPARVMRSKPSPMVVGVVLNWKDADSTLKCVDSLRADPAVSRVVVVDNETDGELRAGLNDDVELIEQVENLGFSRGVNVGLRWALANGADAALVINNDAFVSLGAVGELIRSWLENDGGVLAPLIRDPDGTIQSTGGQFRACIASTKDVATSARVDYLTWACVLLPRATLERVGLLDEEFFMYWEDVDYGFRVREAGLSLEVVEGATVHHERSKSHSRAGNAIDLYSAHGLVVLAKKRGGVVLALGLPVRLTARLLRRLLNRDFDAVKAVLRGARSGWRGLSAADR